MRLQNRLKAAGPCKPGQTAASGCTPASGSSGGKKPTGPANSLSGKVRQAASAVAQGFLKATSAYAKAADTAKRFKSAGFDKLPPSGQRAVTKVWGAAKYVEHKLMTAMRVGKETAVQAAKERGLSPERTERLAKILGTADMVSAWTVNFPATVAVTGSAAAGKLASFLPVASLSYLAYSTARNPLATVRAAKAVMVKQGAGHGHKSFRKAADKGELASLLAERLDGMDDASLDWYTALLSAALDATPDDPAAAVEAADRAMRSVGKPPAGADSDLSEADGALLAGAGRGSLENRLKPTRRSIGAPGP